jgi:hypothetical protein
MLRMSLVAPKEFVFGMFFAGVRATTPIVLASLIALVPLATAILKSKFGPIVIIQGYITLGVCICAALSLSIFASSVTRRVSVAAVISYGLSVTVFIGLTIVVLICGARFNADQAASFVAFACALSPITAYALNLSVLVNGSVKLVCWLVNMILYAAMTLVVLKMAVKNFAKRFSARYE